MYYEGHNKAQKNLLKMSINDLLEVIDGLYGRDNIEDEKDKKEVLAEAQRQVRKDFTNIESSTYKSVSFWTSVISAQ